MKKVIIILSLSAFSLSTFAARHWAHVGYQLNSSLKFDSAESEQSPGFDIETEILYENGLSFGYEYFDATASSWGNSFGFSYSSSVKEKSYETTFKNATTSITTTEDADEPDEVSTLIVYYNWIYRFSEVYFPLGVNITVLSFDSDFGNEYEGGSGGGINVGMGWMFSERVAAEFLVNVGSIDLTQEDEAGQQTEFGSGTFSSVTLRLKLGLF